MTTELFGSVLPSIASSVSRYAVRILENICQNTLHDVSMLHACQVPIFLYINNRTRTSLSH